MLKVGQNIKYDMRVFAPHGIEIGPVDDTMLLSFVLDGGKHGHGMDELAERHLGQKTIKFSDVAGSGRQAGELRQGAARQGARLRRRGRRRHAAALGAAEAAPRAPSAWSTMYETIERPLIPVLLGMEQAGIKVDAPAAQDAVAPTSRSAWASSRARSTRSPAASSTSARPSSSARSCSTSRSCPAASATRTARWATDARCSTTSPRRATRCRSRSWSIASSPSSRAPTPTRWCASSTPRPAASTPRIT